MNDKQNEYTPELHATKFALNIRKDALVRDAAPELLDALEAVNRNVQRSLRDGYGCPFCKQGEGHYCDGEYWHSLTCPLEQVENAIAKARGEQ